MNALTHAFTGHRKSLFWAAGLVMAVLLGVGGTLARSALAGGPSGSSGTGATLNAALSSTASPAATTPAAKARRAAALVRLRRLGGMYGQAAFRGKDGTTRTLAFERGTVTSSGSALVVKAANGTTWTWTYTSSTVVRKGGQKASRSDLSGNEHVLVAGQVTSGTRDAQVIIVRTGARSGASPAPSASSS
jgi:hypothetical protein